MNGTVIRLVNFTVCNTAVLSIRAALMPAIITNDFRYAFLTGSDIHCFFPSIDGDLASEASGMYHKIACKLCRVMRIVMNGTVFRIVIIAIV